MEQSRRKNVKQRRIELRRLIAEGGAVGHLQHVYDNEDLTFGEIKDILERASSGRLQKVSEKLDGMNLVFTWNVGEGQLRMARGGPDIRSGGMNMKQLAAKFFGRGNVEEAFNSAASVLRKALSALSQETLSRIFGDDGNRWYSIEIIYTNNPNTIVYDTNSIVFHGWPIFELQADGSVERTDDDSGIGILEKNIEGMQNAIAERNWKIRGPAMIRLKKLSDGSFLQKTYAKIDAALTRVGVSDNDTIADYMRACFQDEVENLGFSEDVQPELIDRMMHEPDAMSATQMLSLTDDPSEEDLIKDFVRGEKFLRERFIAPIEEAIYDVSLEALKGLESALIADSEKEVQRLRKELTTAINKIEASDNRTAMEILSSNLDKLKGIENIGAPMEGIVFIYRGNAYKFTGAFTPVHRILSLFTFGAKGVPPMKESRKFIKVISEGGNALEGVGPISLGDFNATWPELEARILRMGVNEIEPIGTVGKKQLMGDIDLVVTFDGTQQELYDAAEREFGTGEVVKVGGNIVSFRYPFGEGYGQVDMMMGDPHYVTWSRYGPSPEKGHEEFSIAKGVFRNLLLNTFLRTWSEQEFGRFDDEDELTRSRYALDFDKGLYFIQQTRRGAIDKRTDVPRVLKSWKTIVRQPISTDPDEIAEKLFGRGTTSGDLLTLEDVIRTMRSSQTTSWIADDVLKNYINELEALAARDPRMFGSEDPEVVIDRIKQVAMNVKRRWNP